MGSRQIAVMERASGTESFVGMEDAAVVGGLFCRATAKTALVSAHTGYRIQILSNSSRRILYSVVADEAHSALHISYM